MQDRSLKIYKPQDIEGLLNIDKLKLKTKEECDRLLEETKNKCATLEQETYDAALTKLHAEELKLFEQSYQKITNFFESTKVEINHILNVLFDKLKINENSVQILTQLLFAEVEKLKIKSHKFTIYGNSQVLPVLQAQIKEEYSNESFYFDYDIKPELHNEECLVESDFVMARISLRDFQERVVQVLLHDKLNEVSVF